MQDCLEIIKATSVNINTSGGQIEITIPQTTLKNNQKYLITYAGLIPEISQPFNYTVVVINGTANIPVNQRKGNTLRFDVIDTTIGMKVWYSSSSSLFTLANFTKVSAYNE